MRLLEEIRFRLGSARQAHALHRRIDKSRRLYLDLMERSLTGAAVGREETGEYGRHERIAKMRRLGEVPVSQTMIGAKRLRNLRRCAEDVLGRDVPGDFIETGVWRGGATVMMRAVLAAHGDTERRVWVADSFAGLPPPSEKYPQDAGDQHHKNAELAISLKEVRANFHRYRLLDDQVRFLEGWFEDTLPDAPIERLALVRLDGDMYGSTMDALTSLYPRLSAGGYLIVDDYGAVKGCEQAVDDYRAEHGITEPIKEIDWTGVYWKKD